MREKQRARKSLDQVAVKAMASIARGIAKDSLEARCFLIMHQPEEPKDLEMRLQAMKKG